MSLKQSDLRDFLKKKSNVILNYQEIVDYLPDIPQNNGLLCNQQIDMDLSQNWIYDISKPFRQYQFRIVEQALFNNSLVCLPTGLGKTFIAAIIMTNYYVWFPQGKIYFLAPTRPLVNQQIDCLKNMEQINPDDILEINGNYPVHKRKEAYNKYRVFFLTPQTLENDLEAERCDCLKSTLLVFDEAHRASGNYAYCKIIQYLEQKAVGYRVLALSATPGNDVEKIQEVVTNLCISKILFKDEDDDDVKPYTFKKEITPIVIKQNDSLKQIKDLMHNVLLQPYFWLLRKGIMPPSVIHQVKKTNEITKGTFFFCFQNFQDNMKEFQQKLSSEDISMAYMNLKILSALTHGIKVVNEQGIECFRIWFNEFKKIQKDNQLKTCLLASQEFQSLDKCMNLNGNDGNEAHPKCHKLAEILKEFFDDEDNIKNYSKVMIFTQNRQNAIEIKRFIKSNDKIRPEIFIGQSKQKEVEGMKQKQQMITIQKFKENEFNVLIATCIGEEGLDIGEIDLIICYDSGFSPIRMIQRMGRTGRKRSGQVMILVMEGKEYSSYLQSQKRNNQIKKYLKMMSNGQIRGQHETKKSNIKQNLVINFYGFNPRMIPDQVFPKLKIVRNDRPITSYELNEIKKLIKEKPKLIEKKVVQNSKKKQKLIMDYETQKDSDSDLDFDEINQLIIQQQKIRLSERKVLEDDEEVFQILDEMDHVIYPDDIQTSENSNICIDSINFQQYQTNYQNSDNKNKMSIKQIEELISESDNESQNNSKNDSVAIGVVEGEGPAQENQEKGTEEGSSGEWSFIQQLLQNNPITKPEEQELDQDSSDLSIQQLNNIIKKSQNNKPQDEDEDSDLSMSAIQQIIQQNQEDNRRRKMSQFDSQNLVQFETKKIKYF